MSAWKKDVEDRVRASGSYMQFGDRIYFTDAHIQGFWDYSRASRLTVDPAHSDPGVAFFMGAKVSYASPYFFAWSRPHDMESTMRWVQDNGHVRGAEVLSMKFMSYGQYLEHYRALAAFPSALDHGKWFHRSNDVELFVRAFSEKAK